MKNHTAFWLFLGIWAILYTGFSEAHADQSEIIFFGSPHSSVVAEPEEEDQFFLPEPNPEFAGAHGSFDPSSHITEMKEDKCEIKASFFADVVAVRGSVEDREGEMDKILALVEDAYVAHNAVIDHHEHIDNLRLTRDAYRVNSAGEYVIQDAIEFGIRTLVNCTINGF